MTQLPAAPASRGIHAGAWFMIVFSALQLIFSVYIFREFSFLPRALTWVFFLYTAGYYLVMLYAAARTLKLKRWARDLLIVLLLLGIADKAIFSPLRFMAIDEAAKDPHTRSLILEQYRKTLPADERQVYSDAELMPRVTRELHTAQVGVEAFWLAAFIALLAFYSNRSVKTQFTDLTSKDSLIALPLTFVLIVLLIVAIASVNGILTNAAIATWYYGLVKPPGVPPGIVFGIVWTLLYICIAASFLLVWMRRRTEGSRSAVTFFFVQLFLNAIWSPVFFGLHSIGGGLLVVSALLLASIITAFKFLRISRVAFALLVPYLVWLSYALYLNTGLFVLNW